MTTAAPQYFYCFENLPGKKFSKITSSKGSVVNGDNVYLAWSPIKFNKNKYLYYI